MGQTRAFLRLDQDRKRASGASGNMAVVPAVPCRHEQPESDSGFQGNGTNDWQYRELVLDIPRNAQWIPLASP